MQLITRVEQVLMSWMEEFRRNWTKTLRRWSREDVTRRGIGAGTPGKHYWAVSLGLLRGDALPLEVHPGPEQRLT